MDRTDSDKGQDNSWTFKKNLTKTNVSEKFFSSFPMRVGSRKPLSRTTSTEKKVHSGMDLPSGKLDH